MEPSIVSIERKSKSSEYHIEVKVNDLETPAEPMHREVISASNSEERSQ